MRATPLGALGFFLVLSISFRASAQQWNDGSPSRVAHSCWQGTFPAIAEDLAWTWTGFEGTPVTGTPYRIHVAVGSLGCAGAYAIPQIKLPRNTSFVIDASHRIRCYVERNGTASEITDGGCPTAPTPGLQPTSTAFPNANGQGNEFVSFSPSDRPYWPLAPGTTITIEMYVVTSSVLSGIASNDYLLGAVQLIDNSPGNPTVVDDGAPLAYQGVGIPPSGAWQGDFVFAGPSLAPRIAYPQPVAVDVTETTASTRALLFNSGCVSPNQVRFNLVYPDLTDPPGSAFAGGTCVTQSDGSDSCVGMWTGLQPNTTYAFQATFDPATLTGCPTPQGDQLWQLFTTAAAPTPTEHHTILVRVEGNGSTTMDPEGGTYPIGTSVSVTATPGPGASFTRFVVDGSPLTMNPLLLATNIDHDVVAVFSSTSIDAGTTGDSGTIGASDGGSSDAATTDTRASDSATSSMMADGGHSDSATGSPDGSAPPTRGGRCSVGATSDPRRSGMLSWNLLLALAVLRFRRRGVSSV